MSQSAGLPFASLLGSRRSSALQIVVGWCVHAGSTGSFIVTEDGLLEAQSHRVAVIGSTLGHGYTWNVKETNVMTAVVHMSLCYYYHYYCSLHLVLSLLLRSHHLHKEGRKEDLLIPGSQQG